MINPVTMSTPRSQIAVSKYNSLLEGTSSSWETADYMTGVGNTQDGVRTLCYTRYQGDYERLPGSCPNDSVTNVKRFIFQKVETWLEDSSNGITGYIENEWGCAMCTAIRRVLEYPVKSLKRAGNGGSRL